MPVKYEHGYILLDITDLGDLYSGDTYVITDKRILDILFNHLNPKTRTQCLPSIMDKPIKIKCLISNCVYYIDINVLLDDYSAIMGTAFSSGYIYEISIIFDTRDEISVGFDRYTTQWNH